LSSQVRMMVSWISWMSPRPDRSMHLSVICENPFSEPPLGSVMDTLNAVWGGVSTSMSSRSHLFSGGRDILSVTSLPMRYLEAVFGAIAK